MMPRVSYALTVTYAVKCVRCGATHQETRECRTGDELYSPSIPQGWRIVTLDEIPALYCDKHDVEIELYVDGELQ